jgi:hypothetical protein
MERVVFYRERGALPYDPFAYGVAIAVVEIPYLILQVSQKRLLCSEFCEMFEVVSWESGAHEL